MRITTATLDALRVGLRTEFQGALDMAVSQSAMVATEIPSGTKEERMAWLAKLPSAREWLGDRQIKNLQELDYTIKNKTWEMTIGVDRDDIEDDNLGVYKPMLAEMGDSAAGHKEQLIFNTLKAGFTSNCFDGQSYFNTSHPILDVNGAPTTFANTDGGAGTPWFLMCSKKKIKPLAWTNRKPWQFVSMDKTDDANVFMRKEFLYGIDARYNVGFTLPQLCWGSKQTLNAANYEIARAAIAGMKADNGRPLGLLPDLLVVPPLMIVGLRCRRFSDPRS